jgi:type I restriction enzyme M protein
VPRYKFAWTNLPQPLLKVLARDLNLGNGDPADLLRAEFGARPDDEFVRQAWATLLERWLPQVASARTSIVDRLREAGVGDGAYPKSKQSQLDYLGSRRNARRLREIVLAEFVAAGEHAAHVDQPAVSATPTPRRARKEAVISPVDSHQIAAASAPRVSAAPAPVEALGLTGDLKSKIDRIWDAFWSGGISNPLEVIEQITYLLFLRRLDDLQTLAEKKARRTGQRIETPIFQPGQADLRWSRFKDLEPGVMFKVIDEQVFPFLRQLGGDGSTYSEHMKDARFTIPTPVLLSRVVDMLDDIPMHGRDTNGDLYEYMLAKIATAGQNGQFRTPRHIIALMVAMTDPRPSDEICDPAAGTCGFLVAAAEQVRREHPSVMTDEQQRKHFHHSMFHGYDFDSTMLRIGSMNMLLHGVEQPDVRYRDSLAQAASAEEGLYSLILANPPFAGSLDYETTSKALQQVVKTKKTELLFLALFVRLLKPGGRAAVIVPDGVLFGSSKAHKELRRVLVEDQKLDAVVKLPSGVFRPYAGVSTAILLFTKTNSGGTDHVWFYDVEADGWTLDDRRSPLLAPDQLGPAPRDEHGNRVAFDPTNHPKNNLPDVLARWSERDDGERKRERTEQSFCVPKVDIAAQGYDLSLNRYKTVVHGEVEYRPSLEIIADLEKLEDEIQQGLADLKAMLS